MTWYMLFGICAKKASVFQAITLQVCQVKGFNVWWMGNINWVI